MFASPPHRCEAAHDQRSVAARHSRLRGHAVDLTIYFDESRVSRWGPPEPDQTARREIGERLFVGAVVAPAGEQLEASLEAEAHALLADLPAWESRPPRPDKRDRRELFAREHFHFTNDSLDIRRRALNIMLAHSVRAHVLYSHLEWSTDLARADIQAGMYFTLLRNLLRRYAGAQVRLVFENESTMDALYGRILQHAIDGLDRQTRRSQRHPRAWVQARIGHKPNGGLSTVDYCLGVANLGLNNRLSDGKEAASTPHELESVSRLDRHIAHVLNFDTATHARRFDILKSPGWARNIAGVNSHPTVEESFSTLITRGPTGLFGYVETPEGLAISLGLSPAALEQARTAATDPKSYRFPSAVIRGKKRQFTVPTHPLLISVHTRLLEHLHSLNDALHPSCVGYVPGRRPSAAAVPHVGKRWIQKLDIADFFASTSPQHVQKAFTSLGATPSVAKTLADLTTHAGSLPTGARTSPFLSNLVLADFDYTMARAAEVNGVSYSRYADDLVFSSDERFDMTAEAAAALRPLGYELNRRKSTLRRRGQPIRVAGLSVFELDAPRLPKPMKRRLRLELFLLDKAIEAARGTDLTEEEESELAVRVHATNGLVRYCRSVESSWVARQLAQAPNASEALLPRADPKQRENLVASTVERIRSGRGPRLTAQWQEVGGRPPVDEITVTPPPNLS